MAAHLITHKRKALISLEVLPLIRYEIIYMLPILVIIGC